MNFKTIYVPVFPLNQSSRNYKGNKQKIVFKSTSCNTNVNLPISISLKSFTNEKEGLLKGKWIIKKTVINTNIMICSIYQFKLGLTNGIYRNLCKKIRKYRHQSDSSSVIKVLWFWLLILVSNRMLYRKAAYGAKMNAEYKKLLIIVTRNRYHN